MLPVHLDVRLSSTKEHQSKPFIDPSLDHVTVFYSCLIVLSCAACHEPQKLNVSWNSLEYLPREFYFMHWLVRCSVDNNRIKELSEDIGIMQGLRIFWFGMNQIERSGAAQLLP